MTASDGAGCGRIKDIYFDDQDWEIKFLVAGLDRRQFGPRQVLLTPGQITGIADDRGALGLSIPSPALGSLPLAAEARPVCQQYAAMAMGSPGAGSPGRGAAGADPHLRSARAVMQYQIGAEGQPGGELAGFLFDDESWRIRYLSVGQVIEGRKVHFHLLPQSVERFTWAARRVLLRNLQPVELAAEESFEAAARAA